MPLKKKAAWKCRKRRKMLVNSIFSPPTIFSILLKTIIIFLPFPKHQILDSSKLKVCGWQFQIWQKWQKVFLKCRKHCGKIEQLLVTSKFSFSYCFNRLVLKTRKTRASLVKSWERFFICKCFQFFCLKSYCLTKGLLLTTITQTPNYVRDKSVEACQK